MTPPTPQIGLVIGVVHDDQPRRESAGFEEVLGEPVSGKDMSIEQADPELPMLTQGLISHRFSDADLSGLVINEHKAYRAHAGPAGLGQQSLDPHQ